MAGADRQLAERYPGDRGVRQPVHTVYVPADRFAADLAQDWGRQAMASLAVAGETAEDFAAAIGADPADVGAVYDRVLAKLEREPIEDLRIDFEDGYGARPDAEEDDAAVGAARLLRRAVDGGTAPPFVGIRFKNFERPTRRRGLRTLRSLRGRTRRVRRSADRLCADAAQGDLGRPGRGHDGGVRETRSAARSSGRQFCTSRSRWKPRRRSSGQTAER